MRNGDLRRRRGGGVLLVVLAVLLAGCGHGSNDADARDDVARDASSAPDPSPAPVSLGGVQSSDGPWPVADDAARAAAVDGIAASLSYRWDTIEEDADEARAWSSTEFWNESSSLWGTLTEMAPETKLVSDLSVLAHGVVSQHETRGVYLVLLNQATSSAGGPSRTVDQSVLVTVVAGPEAGEAAGGGSSADAEEATWLLDDVSMSASDLAAASGGPLEAAEQLVEALSTSVGDVDGATLRRMEEVVEDLTTAKLRDEILAQGDTIVNVGAEEDSESRLTAAALADIDADSASVLVVGSRGQRLSVEMVLTDGKWLASDVTALG